MITKSDFKKQVTSTFVSNGFIRRDKVLSIKSDSVGILVEYQKFQYGERYFINLGFVIMENSDIHKVMKNMKVSDCDMYFRLESLFGEHSELIKSAGKLEHADRPNILQTFLYVLSSQIIPILQQWTSIEVLKDIYNRENWRNKGLVLKETHELFSK